MYSIWFLFMCLVFIGLVLGDVIDLVYLIISPKRGTNWAFQEWNSYRQHNEKATGQSHCNLLSFARAVFLMGDSSNPFCRAHIFQSRVYRHLNTELDCYCKTFHDRYQYICVWRLESTLSWERPEVSMYLCQSLC